ncbi:MAG: crossover junction endodeoxyribonuclease RuvC [Chloroflexi bacterium]|jgi:crossover junction endodeoxyribonuclease RuvC|nr:crossover junction endodeoxyribonuclease RuvC [Chloroflexota bacterium]MBT3671292.1 crossover junction endodeoxyribonuclease RuvC [Chloroflexota bacterium]MBT4001765.1 crossover junction endodeoxyribonuclease RuvC [Chloroflexota bacterium]MBT4304249.1 crossover junction endodeoxyribonuclease RuvC [Chloroflexota bacterium]MBT4534268.1 crossover junction endodeoxyribonuclease RuvC [Chloroflexota bacterium]
MLVLGIDPGTAITGYGLVREAQDGSLLAVAHGAITTSSKMAMPDRLVRIYKELNEVIKLHRPDSSAVEKLFFAKNVKTGISVGQGRGVVLLSLAQAEIPIAEYAPVEIKQAVVGYGAADKKQVQEMVKMLLGLDDIPRPDDAADGLAVAICHIHSVRYQTIYEEEV